MSSVLLKCPSVPLSVAVSQLLQYPNTETEVAKQHCAFIHVVIYTPSIHIAIFYLRPEDYTFEVNLDIKS